MHFHHGSIRSTNADLIWSGLKWAENLTHLSPTENILPSRYSAMVGVLDRRWGDGGDIVDKQHVQGSTESPKICNVV